jgi:hypothetical protein
MAYISNSTLAVPNGSLILETYATDLVSGSFTADATLFGEFFHFDGTFSAPYCDVIA